MADETSKPVGERWADEMGIPVEVPAEGLSYTGQIETVDFEMGMASGLTVSAKVDRDVDPPMVTGSFRVPTVAPKSFINGLCDLARAHEVRA